MHGSKIPKNLCNALKPNTNKPYNEIHPCGKNKFFNFNGFGGKKCYFVLV